MSETTQNTPQETVKTPRKTSKAAKKRKSKSAEPESVSLPEKAAPASGFPVFDLSETTPEVAEAAVAVVDATPTTDWPDPEPAISDEVAAPGNPKRKRRRKKGKGSQANASQASSTNEPQAVSNPDQAANAPQHSKHRHKLDSDAVTKLAWKIYLAEVSEEGVALIGDNDARELSRRCFRLAEIFMEEQLRRL